MSITMNSHAGRKGKRGPTSPSNSIHSPPSAPSPLPKIKLSIRPNPHQLARPSSSASHSRASSSQPRRGIFSDSSSSDLTPAEDDDDDDDDVYPQVLSRKGRKRDSLVNTTPSSAREKGKTKASPAQGKKSQRSYEQRGSTPRPTTVGPLGRDRKRTVKLGEVARRRARDDKFGLGGERFGGVTPTQTRIANPLIDSDSTSSYGDDESERENSMSLHDADETDDEFLGSLHEAFAGQDIEDLAYGAGHPDSSMEEEAEMEWWHEEDGEEDDDEAEFIANLTGSDIDQLQSQSSVHASSDDPMSDSSSSSEEGLDEFGFPAPFAESEAPTSDQPLILMENWDGQFVLVQPRARTRRERGSGSGSRTAGSVGESTTMSASEQQLLVDADADDTESDWSGAGDDESDGGDTTDSMAEEDMPVLDSPAMEEIVAGQLAAAGFIPGLTYDFDLANAGDFNPADFTDFDLGTDITLGTEFDVGPSIIITDTSDVVTPALSTSSSVSTAPSTGPVVVPAPQLPMAPPATIPMTAAPIPASLPSTPMTMPPSGPVMGTFVVSEEPCAHAIIDGSKTTTRSPFTRRRRSKTSDAGSVVGGSTTKRRSRSRLSSVDPFSPSSKKVRYSSIPGHPRYIAARRAAQALEDPLDRETTPSEEEAAFSLEDMLDASMLPMNDMDTASTAQSPELRHLFRFDKVPVSMYMRRNFSSASRHRTAPTTPTQEGFVYSSPGRAPPSSGLKGTLAGPLPHPASRMLISPLMQPVEEPAQSRRDRRKARKGRSMDIHPLEI